MSGTPYGNDPRYSPIIGLNAFPDPAPTRVVITFTSNGYLVDEDGSLAVFEAPDDEYGDHRAVRALVYHLWPELTGKRGMRILLPGEE